MFYQFIYLYCLQNSLLNVAFTAYVVKELYVFLDLNIVILNLCVSVYMFFVKLYILV